MDAQEWSRSRYWLCHFLHNRHECAPIIWGQPLRLPHRLAAVIGQWLADSGRGRTGCAALLIRRTVAACGHDPAYVQAQRLFLHEQQEHGKLIATLLGQLAQPQQPAPRSPRPELLLRGGQWLGARYTLSVLLLGDLIDLSLFRMVRNVADGQQQQTLCQVFDNIIRDKQAHSAFLTERLTMQFADFNFVRRNLRRWRLRSMFAVMLGRSVISQSKLISLCGSSRGQLVRECWARFGGVLEQMVPYRREALLAALLAQRQDPYADANLQDR